MGKAYTPEAAARDTEAVLHLLQGRWKLVLLFHLFGGQVQRYSDLERLVPGISQKMLVQQLRQLEADAWSRARCIRRCHRRSTTASRPGARPCVPRWTRCCNGRPGAASCKAWMRQARRPSDADGHAGSAAGVQQMSPGGVACLCRLPMLRPHGWRQALATVDRLHVA